MSFEYKFLVYSTERRNGETEPGSLLFADSSSSAKGSEMVIFHGKYGYNVIKLRIPIDAIKEPNTGEQPTKLGGKITVDVQLIADADPTVPNSVTPVISQYMVDRVFPDEDTQDLILIGRELRWAQLTASPDTVALVNRGDMTAKDALQVIVDELNAQTPSAPFVLNFVSIFEHTQRPDTVSSLVAPTHKIPFIYTKGKRWIDIIDEICYRFNIDWFLETKDNKTTLYAGYYGALRNNTTMMTPEGMSAHGVMPISTSLSALEAPLLAKSDFKPQIFKLDMFRYDNVITGATVGYYLKAGDVSYFPQLMVYSISDKVATTELYVATSPYIPPQDYFRIVAFPDSIAKEREATNIAIAESLLSGNIQRVALQKGTGNDSRGKLDWTKRTAIADLSKASGGDAKYDPVKKLGDVSLASPFFRKDMGMIFPQHPDSGVDAEGILVKPEGDAKKAVVIGELVKDIPLSMRAAGDNNMGTGQGPTYKDFVLYFKNGYMYFSYSTISNRWLWAGPFTARSDRAEMKFDANAIEIRSNVGSGTANGIYITMKETALVINHQTASITLKDKSGITIDAAGGGKITISNTGVITIGDGASELVTLASHTHPLTNVPVTPISTLPQSASGLTGAASPGAGIATKVKAI